MALADGAVCAFRPAAALEVGTGVVDGAVVDRPELQAIARARPAQSRSRP